MAGEFDIADDILSGTQAEASPAPAPIPDVATDILGEDKVARAGFRPTGAISTITGKPIEELDPTSPDPPDFSTVYKASLVKDYEAKKKIYAEARGVPVDRYGIKNGEVVWLDDAGILRSEESRLPQEAIKRLVASGTSPEVLGGIVGSVGGPAGAVGGAMAGETVRQAIAGIALDDPQTAWTNIFRLTGEGLLSLVGELAGRGAIKTANKLLGIGNPEARAIRGALKEEVIDFPAMEAVQKTAADFGIDLNVAQSTKSRNLAAKIEFLRSLPQSEEVVRAVDTLQQEQIEGAIPKFLRETFGDGGGSLEVGRDLSKAAETAVSDLKKRRGAMTKPLYERAFAGSPDPNFSSAEKLYRGTGKNPQPDIFTAPKGSTWASTQKSMAKWYGPDVEEMAIKPGARILRDGTDEFDNFVTGKFGKMEVPVDDVLEAAKKDGYDIVIYDDPYVKGQVPYDDLESDIGTVILNENSVIRNLGSKTVPPQVDVEPVINLIDSHLANAKGDIRRALETLKRDFTNPDLTPGKVGPSGTRRVAGGLTKEPKPKPPKVPARLKKIISEYEGEDFTWDGKLYRGGGEGAYYSPDPNTAMEYAKLHGTEGIEEVNIKEMGKVKVLDMSKDFNKMAKQFPYEDDPAIIAEEYIKTLKGKFDTVVLKNVDDPMGGFPVEVVVLDKGKVLGAVKGDGPQVLGGLPKASTVEGSVVEDAGTTYGPSGLLPQEPTPSPYDTSLLGLHGMKLAIDKKLDRSTASGLDRTIQRELKQVQAVLLKQMDEASPQYKLARRVHALLSKGKTTTLGGQIEASEGLAKLLAETSEKDLVNISTLLLAGNKTRPEVVRELRDQIVKQPEGQKVWDASVANYIEHVFDNIPDSKKRNMGEALVDGVFGRRKQRETLKAATTPAQFQAITDFMTVLKRTGITAPKSDVGVARGLTRKELKRQFESEVLTVLTTPLRTPKRLVADRINEIRFGRGSRKLAETLLSDTAADQLRSLKRLKPGSRRLIEGVGVFLGLTLGNEAEQRVTKMIIGNKPPQQ